MSFTWTLDDVVLDDALNDEMWRESPTVQMAIQPPQATWGTDAFGVQQVMRGEPILPWVPDVVGRDHQLPGAVVVIGAAYAGILPRLGQERPGQDSLTAAKVREMGGPSEFLRVFVPEVMPRFSYYRGIAKSMPSGVGARKLVLADLCRASFVRRSPICDVATGVVDAAPNLFSLYVEHERQQDWLWRRVNETRAEVLVALGTVAEHGVLRLLCRRGASIRCSTASSVVFEPRPGEWPCDHANTKRKIGAWKDLPNGWWVASTRDRTWKVVTIPHPSQSGVDEVHRSRIRVALGQ